jgi:hypothetical protein
MIEQLAFQNEMSVAELHIEINFILFIASLVFLSPGV